MYFIRSILFGAALLTPALAQASDFKSLAAERAQNASQKVPDAIPYTYLVTIEMTGNKDEGENYQGQYRFNPAAAPGERVDLMGASWDDIPKGMRKELEKANQESTMDDFTDEFWCIPDQESYEILASDDVTVLSESETEAVVALGPKGIAHYLSDDGEGERKMPKKIRKRMLSEITFSKSNMQMTDSHIWLSEPTTVKIVAKMKEMDFEQACDIAPNGLPYFSQVNTKIAGKAMGTSFGAIINVTVSDLQPN